MSDPGTRTTCAIVGGGPAGAILALLLARQGIDVTLLESHHDFDRDFRGDTVHPGTLEILDQIGLADEALRLPHSKLTELSLETPGGKLTISGFRDLRTKFPFITMMPQARFLAFIVSKARPYASFHLMMGARVHELLQENGKTVGVRYTQADETRELRADLVVGADGRFSKVRQLARLEPVQQAAPMDVLWFRLPRHADEPHGFDSKVGHGHMLALVERMDEWQVAYVIAKGGYQALHAAGIQQLRDDVAAIQPRLADRIHHLQDWHQVALLSVEASRVSRWHRPGLLLIGDAAHVMSPVGGIGINYAIQDAVAAANLLTEKLRRGTLTEADLAQVQRRREWPTRVAQAAQAGAARFVVGRAFNNRPFRIPFFMNWRPVQRMIARVMSFGVRPERLART